jgi:hypothetical protein
MILEQSVYPNSNCKNIGIYTIENMYFDALYGLPNLSTGTKAQVSLSIFKQMATGNCSLLFLSSCE